MGLHLPDIEVKQCHGQGQPDQHLQYATAIKLDEWGSRVKAIEPQRAAFGLVIRTSHLLLLSPLSNAGNLQSKLNGVI